MKKLLLYMLLCAMPLLGIAQESSSSHKLIKHFDVAVSAGTSGFAFEVSTPLCSWSQVRFGGAFRPYKSYNCSLDVWRPLGMTDDDPIMKMLSSALSYSPSSTVELEGHRKMQNLKLLFDFYPIKKHKNFYVTVGVFYGNKTLVSATNTNASFNTLSFMREYNLLYANAQKGQFLDLSSLNVTIPDNVLNMIQNSKALERIKESEDMTIRIGTYSHDIYGANGNIHHAGENVELRPDQNDVINISTIVNRIKPYIGLGYTLPVSKDSRTSFSIDAGLIFWGGKPKVTTNIVESDGTTTNIDLVNDVDNLPEDLDQYVHTASKYPVYPEVNLRFTRRLW